MKGLILTYIVMYAGSLAALRFPLIGLYVYVGFAVMRPQAIFGWAGNIQNSSLIIGSAILVGWLLQGFGTWKFGRGKSVVIALLAFTAWFVVSATQAFDSNRAFTSLQELMKIVLPFLVGVTLMRERDTQPFLWTVVLCMGYVGFENNLNYMKGYNTAAEGFAGMDNNCFGVALVCVIGPAIALTLASNTWWKRLAAGASTALILHTILLTFSRGAMLGLVAVFFTAFIMMPKKPIYVFGMIVFAVVAVTFTGPQLAQRYGSVFASEDQRDYSSESRVELWRDCMKVVQEYPIFGVGPANWQVIARRYGWPDGKSAHSVWMETAAELGYPGVLALILFFGIAARKLWPLARARMTEANRFEIAVATGVVLSMIGFFVSGQFVSVPGLEVPYYVAMIGAVVLKNARVREVLAEAPVMHPVPMYLPAGGRLGAMTSPTTLPSGRR